MIADRVVRYCGTVGGALAYADRRLKWPRTAAVALGAECWITVWPGKRGVPVVHFFVAKRTTAIGPTSGYWYPSARVAAVVVPLRAGFHRPAGRGRSAGRRQGAPRRRGVCCGRAGARQCGPMPLRAVTVGGRRASSSEPGRPPARGARAVDEASSRRTVPAATWSTGLARVLTGRAPIYRGRGVNSAVRGDPAAIRRKSATVPRRFSEIRRRPRCEPRFGDDGDGNRGSQGVSSPGVWSHRVDRRTTPPSGWLEYGFLLWRAPLCERHRASARGHQVPRRCPSWTGGGQHAARSAADPGLDPRLSQLAASWS